MTHPFLLIFVLACGGDGTTGTSTGTGSGTTSTTGGTTTTTGGGTGSTTGGTAGGIDLSAYALVDASLEVLAGPITCADPTARELEGALYEADGGPDWQDRWAPGAGTSEKYGRGVVIEDFDQDGHLDIFLPNFGRDELFLGLGDGTFVDATDDLLPAQDYNPIDPDSTQGAAAGDFDGNGWLDLVLVERQEDDNRLLSYVPDQGRFVEIPHTLYELPPSCAGDFCSPECKIGSTVASWGDIDRDGDLDLLIAAHFDGPPLVTDCPDGPFWKQEDPYPADPAQLYVNRTSERPECLIDQAVSCFDDVSYLLPQQAHDGYTYAGGIIDLDVDGWPDIYLVNDFGPQATPNVHLRNVTGEQGTLAFEDVGNAYYTGNAIYGMGLSVNDLNGDLLPDLVQSSWDDLVMLESLPDGTWYDSSGQNGFEAEVGTRDVAWGSEIADFDNDGVLDVMVSFGWLQDEHEGLKNPTEQPDGLWLGSPDATYAQVAESWAIADVEQNRGFAVGDLNEDGYLDVVKRSMDQPAHLYLSRCGDAHWLRVRLEQPGTANTFAVGARVAIWNGTSATARFILAGGTNYSSQGPLEAHFGLGDLEVVPQLVVFWPDGAVSELRDVAADQVVRVVRE